MTLSMIDALRAASAWLFFHYYPVSPLGIFGALSLGWWTRGFRDRRDR